MAGKIKPLKPPPPSNGLNDSLESPINTKNQREASLSESQESCFLGLYECCRIHALVPRVKEGDYWQECYIRGISYATTGSFQGEIEPSAKQQVKHSKHSE